MDGERRLRRNLYEPLARLVRDEEQTRTNSIHYRQCHAAHRGWLAEQGWRGTAAAGAGNRQAHRLGASAGSPETWTTRYEYDLLDQLTRITDSQNNVKVMRYDGLARLKFMNDPDRGEMHYVYDDASNLKRDHRRQGPGIQYTYDGANRIMTGGLP